MVIVAMVLYEWPKINSQHKKERRVFILISGLAFSLAVLLVVYPELPGPTQFADWLYRPLTRLLK